MSDEIKAYAQLMVGNTKSITVLFGYIDSKGRIFSKPANIMSSHSESIFAAKVHNNRMVEKTWRFVPKFDICFWWNTPTHYEKEITSEHIKKRYPKANPVHKIIGDAIDRKKDTLSTVLSHGYRFGQEKLPTFKQYWKYKYEGD
jgi:hypothetical protein